jgi:peptidoglycan/xylan/chitin deacetylase (PgdA/CDA1 family)
MPSLIAACKDVWRKNWPEAQAAATGGLPQFIFQARPQPLGSNVPVFCYHVVDAQRFDADLDFLSRNGYVTIDADGLLDHLTGRRPAPEEAVVLTFDDGPVNHHEVVFPLLKSYGMRGVAFIVPRFHEEASPGFAGSSSHLPLRPLNWSQIREMQDSGVIDFQSHTYEHRYLPRWPEPLNLEGSDPEVVAALRGPALAVEEDFRLSRQILEQRLNKCVRHLAFPMFEGTAEALHIGRECGYEGFWWGVLPHCPGNRPGQSPSRIVRLKPEFLRRLPGEGRLSLSRVLEERYWASVLRLWGNHSKEKRLSSTLK